MFNYMTVHDQKGRPVQVTILEWGKPYGNGAMWRERGLGVELRLEGGGTATYFLETLGELYGSERGMRVCDVTDTSLPQSEVEKIWRRGHWMVNAMRRLGGVEFYMPGEALMAIIEAGATHLAVGRSETREYYGQPTIAYFLMQQGEKWLEVASLGPILDGPTPSGLREWGGQARSEYEWRLLPPPDGLDRIASIYIPHVRRVE